jgi:hypothetical protein
VSVYLLCFTNDAGEHVLFSDHAGHYLGETRKPVDERRDEHQAGEGAKLTAAAAAAGVPFLVARTWPGGRAEERRLKGRPKGSRELKELCPNCHPALRVDRWAGGTPAWARQAEPGTGPASPLRRSRHHSPALTPAPAPPAPARPRPDPYQRGVQHGLQFLAEHRHSGRTAGQIEDIYRYITGPWRAQPRHTERAAAEMRGYAETITAGLAQMRAQWQPEPQAEAG